MSVNKLRVGSVKKMEESAINNTYKNETGNEIVFDENFLANKEKNFSTRGKEEKEIIQTAPDGSKISIMYDKFGNKTQTRAFNNHPRITFLLLRTSARGEKQVFVYGQNGEVKGLPENMLDKVINISADEIANSAGIIQTRQEKTRPSYAQTNQPQPAIPIQPVPDYQIPNQTRSNESVKADENTETKLTKDNYEKKTPSTQEEDSSPKVNKETDTLNRQPEEE